MKQGLNPLYHLFFALLFAFMYSNSVEAEVVNLGLAKKEIKSFHTAGQYEQELTQAILHAQEYTIQHARVQQKSRKTQELA